MSREASPRQRLVIGILLVVGSPLMAWVVHTHPEGLRAPAWVAHAALGAFGLAGVFLLAQASGQRQLQRWLPPLLMACLLAPPLWIVFGAEDPRCGMSFPGYFGIAPAWVCRAGFGFGALVGLAMLALMLRRYWAPAPPPAAPPSAPR